MTGEVLSGEVELGMFLNVPVTADSMAKFQIDGIEVVRNPVLLGKLVGILHRCEGKLEFEMLKRLELVGKTLDVTSEGDD